MNILTILTSAHRLLLPIRNHLADILFAETKPDCIAGHLKLLCALAISPPLLAIDDYLHATLLRISPDYKKTFTYRRFILSLHRFTKLTKLNAPVDIIGNERRMTTEFLIDYLSAANFHKWPNTKQEEFFKDWIPKSLKKEGLTDHEKWQPIYLNMINQQLTD